MRNKSAPEEMPETVDPSGVSYDINMIGRPKDIEEYSGPQPNVDFFEGDKVKILHRGRPTGMIGIIRRFEGTQQGKPIARVAIDGVPGGDTVPLDSMQKIAQFMSEGPGRPETDPFVMPDIGETQGHAQKRNKPALQKTCPICGSTNGATDLNCVNCGSELKNPYMVPRQPIQRSAQVGTYMVNPPANRDVKSPTQESFERRKKRVRNEKLLSDEFVDIKGEDHDEQVANSAIALGII